MARCGFIFGRWFAQGVVCSAMMLALVGCGGSGNKAENGEAVSSRTRAEDASVPPTRINAQPGTARPDSAPKPPAPVAASHQSGATTASAAAAATDKLVVTGEVTTSDGSDFGTTVVVSLATLSYLMEGPKPVSTSTTLGSDNTYRLEVTPLDAAHVSVGAYGFLPEGKRLSTDDPAKPLRPGIVTQDFVLVKGAELSGRFVGVDGTLLSGTLRVKFNSPPPTSDAANNSPINAETFARCSEKDGFQLFVPQGEMELTAAVDGYGVVRKMVTAPASGVEIRIGEGAPVEGKVMLLGTRAGVSSATVSLRMSDIKIMGSEASTHTDSSGNFRFKGVSDGTYQCFSNAPELFAVRGGKGSAETKVTQGAAVSGLELFLFPGHTVSGRVTDEELGAPIEGVEISQSGPKKVSVKTDPDGRYKLFPVSYEQLTVKKAGWILAGPEGGSRAYNPARGESNMMVSLKDEVEITHDFQMKEDLSVSGKVTLPNGDAVPEAEVKAITHMGRTFKSVKTSANGSYRVQVFRNTLVRVKASAPGYAVKYSDPIEIADESVDDVNLVLTAGGTLSGVVLDPKCKPAPGAKVHAVHFVSFGQTGLGEWNKDALSGEDGRFTILNVPTDEISLNAERQGFASAETLKVHVESGEKREDITLSLRVAHFIAGRVLDSRKNPISGADISFHGPSHRIETTKTDVDGKYRADKLVEGVYQVNCTIQKPVHQTMTLENVEVDRADVDFVFEDEKQKNVSVQKVVFNCKVLDAKTGQPVKVFVVTPQYAEISKDPAQPGQFTFTGNFNTRYILTVTADGYAPEKKAISAGGEMTTSKQVEFLMGGGASVIGRVVSKGDKSPLDGLKISLRPASPYEGYVEDHVREATKWATSQSDGHFVFEKVAGGDQVLEVKAGVGRMEVVKRLKVEDHKVNDVGDIEVGTGGSLRVKVLRQPGDQPVEGLAVRTILSSRIPNNAGTPSKSFTGKTDAEGTVLFENLTPGPCSVSLESLEVRRDGNIEEGVVSELVITLGGGKLTGIVSYAGKPAGRSQIFLTRVKAKPEDLLNFYGESDSTGHYTLSDIPPGAYRIYATFSPRPFSISNVQSVGQPIDISGQGEQVHDIKMPSGRIPGRVVDAEGNPVRDAYIDVSNRPDPNGGNSESKREKSDQGGAFLVEGLRGGTYEIAGHHPNGSGRSKTEVVTVPLDGVAVPVTLQILPPAP